MTALNIRKNTAQLIHAAANAVENASAKGATDKVKEYRMVLAAWIMPKQ